MAVRESPKATRFLCSRARTRAGKASSRGALSLTPSPIAKKRSIARQTPPVSLTIRRTALAKLALGRRELKHLTDWKDGLPGTELNFKLYRQATNKIVGISDKAVAFLSELF